MENATESTTDSSSTGEQTAPDPSELRLDLLSDDSLNTLAALTAEEQRRRARERKDIETLIEDAFLRLFDTNGTAKNPQVEGSLLICPGSLTGSTKPGGTHDCVFAHVTSEEDAAWVFEHPDSLKDSIRHTTIRGTNVQQSITILPATHGTHITRIASKASNGTHRRKSATAWKIDRGKLTPDHPKHTPTNQTR